MPLHETQVFINKSYLFYPLIVTKVIALLLAAFCVMKSHKAQFTLRGTKKYVNEAIKWRHVVLCVKIINSKS
jgi:hypothetical protein